MRGNDRVLAILTELGGHRDVSLTVLAERVQLPRPTVLRFLRSLLSSGWVTQHSNGHYALGPAVIALAGQYMSTDAVLAAASPVMRALRDELGETISLSRLAGTQRVCVQEFPSLQSLRLVLGLGEPGPLHAGASGLLLLCHLDPHAKAELFSKPLPRLTDRTITSLDAIEEECRAILERGWALTRGQRTPGGVALAVPLADPAAPGGVSALGIYGPDARCQTKRVERTWLDALQGAAAEIDRALGRATT